MDQLFTWRNEAPNPEKILKVELLITRANSVHCDPFFTQDEPNSNLDVYSMTSVDGQLTYTRTVNLSLGVYHFLYKITTVEEAWLETIHSKYKTVLGSGRPVNYIEVGDASPKSTNSFSDCKYHFVKCLMGKKGYVEEGGGVAIHFALDILAGKPS